MNVKIFESLPLRKKYIIIYTFISFFIAFLLAIAVIKHFENIRKTNFRYQVAIDTLGRMQAIKHSTIRAFSLAKEMEVFLKQENGRLDSFETLSKKIFPRYIGVEKILFAPHGVVKNIYPLTDDDKILGKYVEQMPGFAHGYKLAKKEKTLKFGGIVTEKDGVYKSWGILPVYFIDKESTWHTKRDVFWGVIAVELSLQRLYEVAELKKLEDEGYVYSLETKVYNRPQKIMSSLQQEKLIEPVKKEITLYGRTLKLFVAPKEGWTSSWRIFLYLIIAIIFAALLSTFTYIFLSIKRKEQEIAKIALTDTLTALSNRWQSMHLLKDMLKNKNQFISIAYFDVDKFKWVNDTLGHDAGDTLLKTIAKRVRNILSKEHIVGRLGGDEFIIIFTKITTKEEALHLAMKTILALMKPFILQGIDYSPCISMGLVFSTKDNENAEDLVKKADMAMYEAKKCGGRHIHIYNSQNEIVAAEDIRTICTLHLLGKE